MDNNTQKTKLKFNIIDFLIIVAIVALVVVFVFRGGLVDKISSLDSVIEYTVKVSDIQSGSFFLVEEGDVLYSDDDDRVLGKITSKKSAPAEMYTILSNGEIVKSEKPDRIDMYLTVEASGTVDEDGCMIDGNFFVGSGKNISCYTHKLYFNAEVTKAAEKPNN